MIKFALNIKLRYMLRKVLSLVIFIGILANGDLIAQSNLFTNGSLIGTVKSNETPTDWSAFISDIFTESPTPDINDVDNPALGKLGDAVDNTNLSSSTDDGTWVGLTYNSIIGYGEGIRQYVSLEAGASYTISFEQANFGAIKTVGSTTTQDLSDNGKINVWLNHSLVSPGILADGGEIALGTGWNDASLSYTAGISGNYLIGFSAETTSGSSDGAYLSIDNIKIIKQTNNSGGNTPPVAMNDGNSLDEGGVATGNVLNNDADADGDPIIVVGNSLPAHGLIVIKPTGEYEYTHNGDEEFADQFEYTIDDGTVRVTATVFFTINPINDPPVVIKDTFEINEGESITILNSDPNLIINNDFDPDNTVADFYVIPHLPPLWNDKTKGELIPGNKGAFQYIHGCNDASLDAFTYYVSDGIDTSLVSDSVIILINNEPPIGLADTFGVNLGESLTINDKSDGLLENDVDSFACDILTVKMIRPPKMHAGTFTLNLNGTFTYIHDGTLGITQDTIIYSLFDQEDYALEYDTAYINIIYPPPTTTTLTYAVDENQELVVDSIQGIFPFVKGNNNLPITVELWDDLSNGPFRGNLLPSGEINEDGSFIYKHDCTDTPNEDYFLYKVKDSLSEAIDTVKITINNVCPEGKNDEYDVLEGQTIDVPLTLGVTENDEDDNPCDPLTVTIVDEPQYHTGTFTLNPDGSFIYSHDDSENFTDMFSYRLSDGECTGGVYVVNINIEPVDDKPPICNDDSYSPCVKEGDTLEITLYDDGVLGNDNDPDIKDSILTAILVDDVVHGKLSFNDDGTFIYIHDGGEDEFDFFRYIANDGDFNSIDTALVTICIDQVNDCPVANDDYFSINEGERLDSTVVRNDTDEDINTDDNNYRAISSPSEGTLVEMRSDGSFVYIPPDQIPLPGPLIVSFDYEITDPLGVCYDMATVTIRINSVNDCPVAVNDTITVDALNNDLIIKDIISNDIDPDSPLDSSSVFIVDAPNYGDLKVNDDGTISYMYVGSPTKKDSLTYTVQDSVGCISNYAKVLINIENIQFPEYELPSYFTPNQDRFNDFFTIKYKNIIPGNVRFEVKIVDRYQRIVFEGDINNDMIWDGMDMNTTGEAKRGLYYYEITPIEYGSTRARTLVGAIFLDR